LPDSDQLDASWRVGYLRAAIRSGSSSEVHRAWFPPYRVDSSKFAKRFWGASVCGSTIRRGLTPISFAAGVCCEPLDERRETGAALMDDVPERYTAGPEEALQRATNPGPTKPSVRGKHKFSASTAGRVAALNRRLAVAALRHAGANGLDAVALARAVLQNRITAMTPAELAQVGRGIADLINARSRSVSTVACF
jgi:hypothetical protein